MAALAQCRKEKATLIIAKLDRLGRNVAFIANLMESRVQFRAVNNPHADELMIHLLAAFAQHERKQISTRTKDELQAALRRGVQLGKHGKEVLSKQNSEAADEFAERMRPIDEQIEQQGMTTIWAIRDELNQQEIPTYRSWRELAYSHRTRPNEANQGDPAPIQPRTPSASGSGLTATSRKPFGLPTGCYRRGSVFKSPEAPAPCTPAL